MNSEGSFFHHDVDHLFFLSKSLPITSAGGLFLAYFVTAVCCWGERGLSLVLERMPYKYPAPLRRVFLRTALYGMSIVLRYFVMLLLMSFHLGFFLVIVFSTVIGQLVVEYLRARACPRPAGTAEFAPFSTAPSYIKLQDHAHRRPDGAYDGGASGSGSVPNPHPVSQYADGDACA